MTLEYLIMDSDAWASFKGKVYDISAYAKRHPGGSVIYQAAGRDGTELFNRHHSYVDIDKYMANFYIGRLASY